MNCTWERNDHIIYFSLKQLRHSELTLFQNQCKIEGTQILCILMLAMQSTRLAGYMLFGNRSMFLDTGGSVALLNLCPKFLSPLIVLDQCYDRIPTLYERTTKYVDPITRQTFNFVSEIPCLGDYTVSFQLDLGKDSCWCQLLPNPMAFNKPWMFESPKLGHITQSPTFDTRRAVMYTPKQMQMFWYTIIHTSVSHLVLNTQPFSHKAILFEFPTKEVYNAFWV